MAIQLRGKPVVDRMAQDMGARIEVLRQEGIVPTLALVRVGARPDDLSYERTAVKRAESLGIAVKPYTSLFAGQLTSYVSFERSKVRQAS